jgi:hypothetical protein
VYLVVHQTCLHGYYGDISFASQLPILQIKWPYVEFEWVLTTVYSCYNRLELDKLFALITHYRRIQLCWFMNVAMHMLETGKLNIV